MVLLLWLLFSHLYIWYLQIPSVPNKMLIKMCYGKQVRKPVLVSITEGVQWFLISRGLRPQQQHT